SRIVTCENPEMADQIYKEKKGLIFFCAHQSNWELLFLDGTKRMNGLAIAKPIKNKQLYRWILTIRERFGGKIVPPTQAIKESLRALKKGWFVGIVGDEALPDSGYCYPLFHQKTYVSSAPALLSYKTGCPMIFAWTQRKKKGYTIRYSAPTYPDLNKPMDVEVPKMMDVMMQHLEKSVQNSMGEWFWQHNRWKRQSIRILYRRYRQDSICIILPLNPSLFEHIPTFLSIYPSDQMTVFLPKATSLSLEKSTLCHYETLDEVYVLDYRFRLVFDFTNTPSIRKHFLRLSAKYVFHIPDLYAAAQEHLKPHHSLSDVIQRALCKPHTIWNNNRPLA
ncbi:MAG TPA: hypothetical protein VJK48_03835, partial [Chlamydiales bacterium]|nr:hypothetical protein [Chlamydiales bacterium]